MCPDLAERILTTSKAARRTSKRRTDEEGEIEMNRTLVAIFGAAFALVALMNGPGSAGATDVQAYCADAEEAAFLTLINAYRAEHGLTPLASSQTLSAAAEHHSQDIALNDIVGHTGSDGSTPKDRMVAHGYGFDTWWGENVFAGDETAAGAFAWWQASPGHNANMLSTNFTAIGIARAYDADSTYGWYWTTVFGGVVDGAACVDPGQGQQPPADRADPADPDDDADDADQNPNGGMGGDLGERADGDGDGLYDDDETDVYGTDPQMFDTDGDGSSDGEEIYYGTDPFDGNGNVHDDAYDRSDGDGDGLYDDDETDVYGTDPYTFDTDGDGAGDGEEVYNGTDPLDAYDY
jgi:uncharacterized protein YkwD